MDVSVAEWLAWLTSNCGRIGAIGSSPSNGLKPNLWSQKGFNPLCQCVYVYVCIVNPDIQTLHRCSHTSIHIHTYIHTYINTYIHTYINTYIHTYFIQSSDKQWILRTALFRGCGSLGVVCRRHSVCSFTHVKLVKQFKTINQALWFLQIKITVKKCIYHSLIFYPWSTFLQINVLKR